MIPLQTVLSMFTAVWIMNLLFIITLFCMQLSDKKLVPQTVVIRTFPKAAD